MWRVLRSLYAGTTNNRPNFDDIRKIIRKRNKKEVIARINEVYLEFEHRDNPTTFCRTTARFFRMRKFNVVENYGRFTISVPDVKSGKRQK